MLSLVLRARESCRQLQSKAMELEAAQSVSPVAVQEAWAAVSKAKVLLAKAEAQLSLFEETASATEPAPQPARQQQAGGWAEPHGAWGPDTAGPAAAAPPKQMAADIYVDEVPMVWLAAVVPAALHTCPLFPGPRRTHGAAVWMPSGATARP